MLSGMAQHRHTGGGIGSRHRKRVMSLGGEGWAQCGRNNIPSVSEQQLHRLGIMHTSKILALGRLS